MNSAASRLVLEPYSEQVVIDTARDALREIGGRASCAFVFASADYRENLGDFLELVQLHAHAPVLAGCSGAGLVGAGVEEENAQGFSLLLLNLPDTRIHTAALPPSAAGPAAWRDLTGVAPGAVDAWIALGDPYQLAVEPWLGEWNAAFPGVPTIGGLASGGQRGDEFFVFHERKLVEGITVVGFQGGVRVHPLVSQGCRPIGEPLAITGAEENFVTTLGSRPAYEVLDEMFGTLPEADKRLAQGNLFVGLAMSEYLEEFKTGDFLIRNLLGADPGAGVLAIGAQPRVGQTLQFQLRDRASADNELRHMCAEALAAGVRPFASLLFVCGGRGRGLFGAPNHDAAVIAETLGAHPGAGVFCNGELGPVGDKNFAHGYTATAALFCNP